MEQTTNQRRIVVFSKDEALINVLVESMLLVQGTVTSYPYNTNLNDVSFDNSVILLDYDTEDFDTREFLPNLVRTAGPDNSVLVVSKDCERKNVIDCAKRGATRFIVKPLNKKRFKRFVLPYLTINTKEEVTDTTDTTETTI